MQQLYNLYTTIITLLDHVSKIYHDCNLFLHENGMERSCLCDIRQAHIFQCFCDKGDLLKSVEISQSLDPISIEKLLDFKPPINHDSQFKFLSSVLQVTVLQLKDVKEYFFRYLTGLSKIVHGLDDVPFEIEWQEFVQEVPSKITFISQFTSDLMSYLQVPMPAFSSTNLLSGQAFIMECSPRSRNVKVSFNAEAKMSSLTQRKIEYIIESLNYSHGPGLRLLKQ